MYVLSPFATAELVEWNYPNNQPLYTSTNKLDPYIIEPGSSNQTYLLAFSINSGGLTQVSPQVVVCPLYASPQDMADNSALDDQCISLIQSPYTIAAAATFSTGVIYAISFSLVNSLPTVNELTAISSKQLNYNSGTTYSLVLNGSYISFDLVSGQYNLQVSF